MEYAPDSGRNPIAAAHDFVKMNHSENRPARPDQMIVCTDPFRTY